MPSHTHSTNHPIKQSELKVDHYPSLNPLPCSHLLDCCGAWSPGVSPEARSVQIGNSIYPGIYEIAVFFNSVADALSFCYILPPTTLYTYSYKTEQLPLWVFFQSGGRIPPDPLAEHQWKCNAWLPISSLAICVQRSAVGAGSCTDHGSSGLCAAAASEPARPGLAAVPQPERGRQREPALFNEALQREGAALPKIIQQSARPVTPRAALSWTHRSIHTQNTYIQKWCVTKLQRQWLCFEVVGPRFSSEVWEETGERHGMHTWMFN